MIQYEIKKYETEFRQYQQFPYPTTQQRTHQTPYYPGNEPNTPMDKLSYANYLSRLDLKPGDWVAFKEVQNYSEWNILLVHNIEEIHHLVKDWGTARSGPKCLWLRGYRCPNGVSKGYFSEPQIHGANLYKKVDNKHVPQILLDIDLTPS